MKLGLCSVRTKKTGQVWRNCQVYKLPFIRRWINKEQERIRTLEAQIDEKNKNNEVPQNVTGCY